MVVQHRAAEVEFVEKEGKISLLKLGGFKFFYIFVYNVEACMNANTHNARQGEQETRGVGEGRTKQWGTETLRDLWKGEGWGGDMGNTR